MQKSSIAQTCLWCQLLVSVEVLPLQEVLEDNQFYYIVMEQAFRLRYSRQV